ncbi:Isoflavone reductase-like protein [Hibiscus syriacus]|uniref:Isoflavone reductase-like protein n=1 Tax=Hibiscus syriacus TaxID=106335 RepID=A0A6A2Z145_HIBSY|nr:Isoflavone reductase-like protein [Hibiscus syriacus]
MAEKSKILIIGGTGYIGKFLVEASTKLGHPTFVLVRNNTISDPQKSKLIEIFKSSGVATLYGDIYDHQSLLMAINQVDIRFLPSEFGMDAGRVHAVEPAAGVFRIKAKIRRAIEAEGIPYTYMSSNAFAGHFLPNLMQEKMPPFLLGIRASYLEMEIQKEDDIANYTIKAAEDPRTLNKILYMRPPSNVLSFNEIVSLWERKIGSVDGFITITGACLGPGKRVELGVAMTTAWQQLKRQRGESHVPRNFILSFSHPMFVKGKVTNFNIEACFGLASELYPEVKYTTVDEYSDQFIENCHCLRWQQMNSASSVDGFIAITGTCLGPGKRVEFGESPNFQWRGTDGGVAAAEASTWRWRWWLNRGGGWPSGRLRRLGARV